jgi:NAD(P) transhydrogenase subunit alpha
MVIVVALTALMLVGFTQSVTAPPASALVEAVPPASSLFDNLYIFILAGFVGLEVIGRVSPTLHTPLMSATNAISGISLVGSIVAAGASYSLTSSILGFIAVAAATTNVVGGFMITDRMLKMFKRKPARGH